MTQMHVAYLTPFTLRQYCFPSDTHNTQNKTQHHPPQTRLQMLMRPSLRLSSSPSTNLYAHGKPEACYRHTRDDEQDVHLRMLAAHIADNDLRSMTLLVELLSTKAVSLVSRREVTRPSYHPSTPFMLFSFVGVCLFQAMCSQDFVLRPILASLGTSETAYPPTPFTKCGLQALAIISTVHSGVPLLMKAEDVIVRLVQLVTWAAAATATEGDDILFSAAVLTSAMECLVATVTNNPAGRCVVINTHFAVIDVLIARWQQWSNDGANAWVAKLLHALTGKRKMAQQALTFNHKGALPMLIDFIGRPTSSDNTRVCATRAIYALTVSNAVTARLAHHHHVLSTLHTALQLPHKPSRVEAALAFAALCAADGGSGATQCIRDEVLDSPKMLACLFTMMNCHSVFTALLQLANTRDPQLTGLMYILGMHRLVCLLKQDDVALTSMALQVIDAMCAGNYANSRRVVMDDDVFVPLVNLYNCTPEAIVTLTTVIRVVKDDPTATEVVMGTLLRAPGICTKGVHSVLDITASAASVVDIRPYVIGCSDADNNTQGKSCAVLKSWLDHHPSERSAEQLLAAGVFAPLRRIIMSTPAGVETINSSMALGVLTTLSFMSPQCRRELHVDTAFLRVIILMAASLG